MLNRASLVVQMVKKKNLLAMQETGVWSLGGKDSLENGMAPHCSILAENPMDNPMQNSPKENPMDRGAWQATVMGLQSVKHEWTTTHTLKGWMSCLLSPGKLLETSLDLCSSQQLPGCGSFLWRLLGVPRQLWEADPSLSCMLPY